MIKIRKAITIYKILIIYANIISILEILIHIFWNVIKT